MQLFPVPRVSSFRVVQEAATAENTSPLTLDASVQDFGGRRWIVEMALSNMTRDEGNAVSAFLNTKSAGQPFLIAMPIGVDRTGIEVDGADQTGTELATIGWEANAVAIKAGQFISIGPRLYQVTATATADGDGRAVLNLNPKLRTSPANGSTVEVKAPQVVVNAPNAGVPTQAIAHVQSYAITMREMVSVT